MNNKFDFEYVKQYFAENDCELLEKTYPNARTPLRYICSCGTESMIRFYSFRCGNRCWRCGRDKVAKAAALTHEEVSAYFSSQGCQLLENYVLSRIPMEYICICGNISKSNWNNFKRGRRCKECLRIKRSGSNNYQWIEDREAKKEYEVFKQRCYKTLKIALAAINKEKSSRTEEMLGYSIKDFQKHITSHPNYNAVKDKRWHVDHIYPIKAFADYGVTDVKIINGLDNLQPLMYNENISKGGKYEPIQFENWLFSKNIDPRRVR